MKKFKVKVSNVTEDSLKRLQEIQINKARACVAGCPFATKLYVAMKTGLTIEFLKANEKEIWKN